MKKLLNSLLLSFFIGVLSAAEEIEPVIDITPDRPKLTLPTPPAEIKVTDALQTSTGNLPVETKEVNENKHTQKMDTLKPFKKPFTELTQEEQIKVLKHKIDKLRKRSHEIRQKFRKLKYQVAELKQEVTDLKQSALKEAAVVEQTIQKPELSPEISPQMSEDRSLEMPEEEIQEEKDEPEAQGE